MITRAEPAIGPTTKVVWRLRRARRHYARRRTRNLPGQTPDLADTLSPAPRSTRPPAPRGAHGPGRNCLPAVPSYISPRGPPGKVSDTCGASYPLRAVLDRWPQEPPPIGATGHVRGVWRATIAAVSAPAGSVP